MGMDLAPIVAMQQDRLRDLETIIWGAGKNIQNQQVGQSRKQARIHEVGDSYTKTVYAIKHRQSMLRRQPKIQPLLAID